MTVHLVGGLKDGCVCIIEHPCEYIVIPVQAPFEEVFDDAAPLITAPAFYQCRYVRKPNQDRKYHNSPWVFIPE